MNSQTFQSSLTSEQFQEVEAFLQARKNKTYTKINGYDLYYQKHQIKHNILIYKNEHEF